MVGQMATHPYFFLYYDFKPSATEICTRDEGMKDPIRSSSILLVVECGFQPFRVTRECTS